MVHHRPIISTQSRRVNRRVWAALPVVLALVLAACGSSGERAATTAEDESGLPTLPPIEQREPELFDERGCLVLEPGSSDCSTRAEEIDAAAAGAGTDAWRTLAGFTGRYYREDPGADAVVVLEETVATTTSGPWSARGLVRNERTVALAGLVLHASLRATDGSELAETSGAIPVTALRPGEPAPFVVGSDVPAEQVASVVWSVSQDPERAVPGNREVELVTYWERGFGDPRPVDMYLHRDVPPAHPYLLFGSATNLGGDALRAPRVVAAWLDGTGRVIWTAEATVTSPDAAGEASAEAPTPTPTSTTEPDTDTDADPTGGDGTPTTVEAGEEGTELAGGSAGDFLFVIDQVPGLQLDGLQVMLWAVSG